MIQLIVGLGNPGPKYDNTRHNAGTWLVRALAGLHDAPLKSETKFKGELVKANIGGHAVYLFVPSSYMNESGWPVKAVMDFYKIPAENVLVAHDELDFEPGDVKLKEGGGHGGHNGLRDLLKHIASDNFKRARIGIGHPGNKNMVHDYVLRAPKPDELNKIEDTIAEMIGLMPTILSDWQAAMKDLHT